MVWVLVYPITQLSFQLLEVPVLMAIGNSNIKGLLRPKASILRLSSLKMSVIR